MNPKVTVGIPVFNGGHYLDEVLHSICNQTYTDIEILISDNCSNDATQEISTKFGMKDLRIKYFRQSCNIGAKGNFEWLLRNAKGYYFMWAAADDTRSPNFIEECVKLLDSDKECVAASGLDKFSDLDYINSFEIIGSKAERMISFLSHALLSNAMFYSLGRREVITGYSFDDFDGIAADWTYIAYLASHGSVRRCPSAMTIFQRNGLSHSSSRYSALRLSIIEWIFPLVRVGRYINKIEGLSSKDIRRKMQVKLFELNRWLALDQASIERQNYKGRKQEHALRLVAWAYNQKVFSTVLRFSFLRCL